MMARSTTGTSNVSSSATISGICNNHRALAGIGSNSLPNYVAAHLCRGRDFLTYDNTSYQFLSLSNCQPLPFQ
jgi:hypothetical protein